MDNIVEQYIGKFALMFDEVIKRYEANQETLKRVEGEECDLSHEIELSKKKGMYEGYLIYLAQRELLIDRRRASDENAMLEELYQFCKSQINIRNKLRSILGNSQTKCKSLNNRQYTPRVRTDLTITDNKPKNNRPFEVLMSRYNKDQKDRKTKKYA